MAFDLLLYVSLTAGFAAGRLTRWRSPWVERAAWGSVVALVFLLGASLDAIPAATIVTTIPIALVFAAVLVGATLLIFAALPRRANPAPATTGRALGRIVPAPFLLAALLAGYLTLGRVDAATATPVEIALDALVFLVAFDLTLNRGALRQVWRPLGASVLGATIAAMVIVVALREPLAPSLATGLGFGWYSLAGPLVGAQVGPTLGLLAFLANFVREDLTMLLARPIARRFPGGGLAAVGGATSMDTTLAFSVAYDPPDGATLGLGTGIVLTIAASLVVPSVLALSQA